MAFKTQLDKQAYWRTTVLLLLKLLVIWFIVSFGCGILLVEQLNQFQLFGFKLGFWFAQQGAIYCFVLLIFYYVYAMNKIDQRFGVDEE
jgi:putative solute:sodium symporter small subunit